MKIVIVGASGVIGKAVAAELSQRHDIVHVGRSGGDFQADIADPDSIRRLYRQIGEFDALVCAAGADHFAPLAQFTPDQYEIGLRSKLMGQVNLVTFGLGHVRDGGSFTLTSGLISDDPIPQGASVAMVNAALEGFVRGAAIEFTRGVRINLVSPTVIEESVPIYGSYFRGTKPVPASEAALAYAKSVEGAQNGRVYRVGWSRDSY